MPCFRVSKIRHRILFSKRESKSGIALLVSGNVFAITHLQRFVDLNLKTMKHLQKFKTIIGISVAVLSFAVAPALAQDQEEQQQQQPALPGTPGGQAPDIKDDFSDETLEKFVDINQKLAHNKKDRKVNILQIIQKKNQ